MPKHNKGDLAMCLECDGECFDTKDIVPRQKIYRDLSVHNGLKGKRTYCERHSDIDPELAITSPNLFKHTP